MHRIVLATGVGLLALAGFSAAAQAPSPDQAALEKQFDASIHPDNLWDRDRTTALFSTTSAFLH